MRSYELERSLDELTAIQRHAVNWNKGALLVLAGPGSGKTRVLTCRMARLLDESRDQRFRVLALTFTDKAADEMMGQVNSLVPDLKDRAKIFTFHGFCSKILRQHGSHVDIRPNFRFYSQREDREALLRDALRHDSKYSDQEIQQFLPLIDRLKSQLISPDQAQENPEKSWGTSCTDVERLIMVYRRYEEELQRVNALDLNSLIFFAYRLCKYPVVAKFFQSIYKYWLIDEFQDTSDAQYKLLKRMAAGGFQEVFAVADDDQTIYEWNGADVRRISALTSDFSCKVIQLPVNFRCPPPIVDAANRLMVYNAHRLEGKHPSKSIQDENSAKFKTIQSRVFSTDTGEAEGLADEIAAMNDVEREESVVLARSRSLLQSVHNALKERNIHSLMLMRRDDFLSPKMRWLIACLRQVDRPLDLRNLAMLVGIFESIAPKTLVLEDILARADSESISYLSVCMETAQKAALPSNVADAISVVSELADRHLRPDKAIEKMIGLFDRETDNLDLQEDLSAWKELSRGISVPSDFASLGQFLQELDLRSKDPPPPPGSVSLATIHGVKGLEFDTVYLMGLAEGILPSWHSIQGSNGCTALVEEERRACFVAITRTKKRLVLSRANQYRRKQKPPSRFLEEMGVLDSKTCLQNKPTVNSAKEKSTRPPENLHQHPHTIRVAEPDIQPYESVLEDDRT